MDYLLRRQTLIEISRRHIGSSQFLFLVGYMLLGLLSLQLITLTTSKVNLFRHGYINKTEIKASMILKYQLNIHLNFFQITLAPLHMKSWQMFSQTVLRVGWSLQLQFSIAMCQLQEIEA